MEGQAISYDLARCLLAFQGAERDSDGMFSEDAQAGAYLWAETLVMLRGFMRGGDK